MKHRICVDRLAVRTAHLTGQPTDDANISWSTKRARSGVCVAFACGWCLRGPTHSLAAPMVPPVKVPLCVCGQSGHRGGGGGRLGYGRGYGGTDENTRGGGGETC